MLTRNYIDLRKYTNIIFPSGFVDFAMLLEMRHDTSLIQTPRSPTCFLQAVDSSVTCRISGILVL